ncbi:Undecaprenyl phosphate-alpha-4-amino-4-deoxy-L-arabinose arabinosyl transferase [Methylacidimicrobium cyclopophantes]|uniref:Undecaprenyl phosphate-alpha-4-amino-4-deoxy-L-arabinose arabinosyl transferase n=1 Tax=Methylacidimicrobium cyclopophantes TaxID=1041766 RepID=A0A5E6M5B6_9BACT|nr:Undecaprenyl phosphate-alpha-4-amino-4-deoxy-L-arabinose arabinosyl transferase [Methylacidimicrobium cyclopophantes]
MELLEEAGSGKNCLHRFRPFYRLFDRLSLLVSDSRGADVLGFLVIGALGAFYIAESGHPVIFDDNEGLYAGAAREMRARGDWILPTLDGVPRCQKPPLVYWLILLSTGLFGENEFAVRLPQALAMFAWIGATYSLGASLRGRNDGLMGASILGTAFGSFVFGHILMPEIFLAASIAWSFWFLWKTLTEGKKRYLIGLWIAIAVGTLAKGLHALFYPLAVVGLLVLFAPEWRRRAAGIFRWEGITLFFCLVIPWYALMEGRLPGFLWEHFGNEQFGHAVNRRYPPDAGTVRLPVFLSEQFLFLLPWSLFAAALWLPFPHRKAVPTAPRDRGTLFLGLWILVTFFSLVRSSLQDYYALSCFPALALYLARPFCRSGEGQSHWTIWIPFAVIVALAAAAGAAGLCFWSSTHHLSAIAAAPVDRRDNFLAAIFGFSFSTWRAFVPLLLWASLSLILGGTAALWFAFRGNRLASGLCLALSMLLPLAEAGRGFQLLEDYFSSEKIARYLNTVPAGNRRIIADGEPNFFSSLFFYLRKGQVFWLHSSSASSFVLRSWPESQKLSLSEEEFLRLWSGERPIYLICEQSAMKRWKPIFDETTPSWKAILRCGTRVLVVNGVEGGS